jgi:hypothetical protein
MFHVFVKCRSSNSLEGNMKTESDRPRLRLKGMFVAFTLICFGLSPRAQAVNPPPDGGYGPPTYGTGNTAEGEDALLNLGDGNFNTANGYRTLYSNTTGSFNTAIGAGALFFNTGGEDTAIGAGALLNNTTGVSNTATGESALFSNTTGSANTANGVGALQTNTTGIFNTGVGSRALLNNTTGRENTANGEATLFNNTTGNSNTAIGQRALVNNTTGDHNTAIGVSALFGNTTGVTNVAIGVNALEHNTTGAENIGLGVEAGSNQTTGGGNIYIGRGVRGTAGESGHTYIRNINITGVNGAAVTVDVNTGLLGHATSSRRYKERIQPMDQSSEMLYQLKPVTFRYKKELDQTQPLSFGLIAEDVAEVNPNLILRDTAGRPETVRYEAVNAMLLNEFLKEHRHVQEQDTTIARQQKQIDALIAGLQKVTAQLELSKAAPQTVLNK